MRINHNNAILRRVGQRVCHWFIWIINNTVSLKHNDFNFFRISIDFILQFFSRMECEVKCSICEKPFTQSKCICVHTRKIHDPEPLLSKDNSCKFCDKILLTPKT